MKKSLFITIILLAISWTIALAEITNVHFQWGPSTGQVDGYRIYYGDSEGGPYPEQLCEVNGTVLDYIASLDKAQEYYIVCRAFNNYGESRDSNEVHWLYNIPGSPGILHWSINLTEILKGLGADQIEFISK